MTETRTAQCGHEYAPPPGGDATEHKLCPACHLAAELATMRDVKTRSFIAYLSPDKKEVTTSTGGYLGKVHGLYYQAPGGAPHKLRAHFGVVDVNGHKWNGRSRGAEKRVVKLTRVRV